MMRKKPIGSAAIALLVALMAGADAVAAPTPPPPMMPCGPHAGKCHDVEINVPPRNTGGSGTRGRNPSPPPGPPAPAPPPTPEQIARAVRQELLLEAETFLPQPQVATNPGTARPSIIDVPTFFVVTNWLPQQVDRFDDEETDYYIQVTATPTLRLDPGEPGAPTITCEDGGTRYDPDGPSPQIQAARPGACAYTYTRRTGVAGRPDAWTARVMVSWTLDWETNLPVPLPDDLATSDLLVEEVEREVDEVSTVVERRD